MIIGGVSFCSKRISQLKERGIMEFRSIAEAVANHAKNTPEKLCVADGKHRYTYRDFYDYACQIASSLSGHKGEILAVRCSQDGTFLALKVACELAGCIFVPIEKEASLLRIREIISETDAFAFVTDKEVEDIPCGIMPYPEYEDVPCEGSFPFPDGEATAEVLFTTGTTGKSKGVEISNRNNVALAENIMYGAKIRKNSVELIPLPISHSHGLRSCYANLLNGSGIVLSDGVMMIRNLFDMINEFHVTAMDFSPSAVKVLIKLAKERFFDLADQLDYIEIGTAVLDEETKKTLIDHFPNTRLYNFYGSTESGRSCVLDFRKENLRKCVGKPTRHARFIVTDENRKEILSSEDNMGLLACCGAMNMKGYWKQKELTEQTMRDGFVYTNDLSYIDENGYVYVYGRKDSIINFGGIKIAPDELEEQIIKYKGIKDCACVPKNDSVYGQIPYLYITVENKDDFDMAAFMSFMKEHIDYNKLPKKVEIIDSIPRTFNGKLQRDPLIRRCNDSR